MWRWAAVALAALLWRTLKHYGAFIVSDTVEETHINDTRLQLPVSPDRVGAALQGALVGDAVALCTQGVYDLELIRSAFGSLSPRDLKLSCPGAFAERAVRTQSHFGDELVHALDVVARRGFNFESFARDWHAWAEVDTGPKTLPVVEALRNLQNNVPRHASGSHADDLVGASRSPALLLLSDRVHSKDLGLAAQEIQLVSHGNPKSLLVGAFLIRVCLRLLDDEVTVDVASRRQRTIAALRASAVDVTPSLLGHVDDAVSELQAREAFAMSGAQPDAFERARDDVQIIQRILAGARAEVVQGAEAQFAVAAVMWLLVAYTSFDDAAEANLLLGGETCARGLFVGLVIAARDGVGLHGWHRQPPPYSAPAFVAPLQLCSPPTFCGGSTSSEHTMYGVTVAVAVTQLSPRNLYRIFLRSNATKAFDLVRPRDWDDDEDGDWLPVQSQSVRWVARYLQFTTAEGWHVPLGRWPVTSMHAFTPESPVVHESLDVELPEALVELIGGMVVSSDVVVYVPRVAVSRQPQEPTWAPLCDHLGHVTLPSGRWRLE